MLRLSNQKLDRAEVDRSSNAERSSPPSWQRRNLMQALKKIIATVACVSGLLGSSGAAGYAQLTVFGDSLADSGNVFVLSGGLFPPSPPYAQRLSNGPTAVDVLAANLGLPLTPSL